MLYKSIPHHFRNHISSFFKKGIPILILITGTYLTYPYLTLWLISQAIQNHDTAYLAKKLNWHSIQNNLKTLMTSDFQDSSSQSQDDLPDFGNSFATTAINNAIDAHINNSALHILLDYLTPPSPATHSPIKNGQSALQIFSSCHIYFSSPTTLHTQISLPNHQVPLRITMKLQQWQWKITDIHLPDQILTQFFQNSDK